MSAAKPKVITNIQVLRFVAALLVVIAHAFDVAGDAWLPSRLDIADFGAIGVDVFFVVSGFIIARVGFQGAPRPPARFLADRVRRVVPLYWLMSAPWVAIGLARHDLWIRRPIVTILFWPAIRGRVVDPVLEIGWTLCFEMLFYVAAAATLALPRRPALAAIAVAYACCWAMRDATGAAGFRFLGNPIVLEFAMGVAAALASRHVGPRMGLLSLALGVAAMAASPVVGYGAISESHFTTDGTLSLTRALAWGLPAALVVLGAVAMPPWRTGRWAIRLGDASYALYLVHPLWLLALGAALAAGPRPSPGTVFAIAVAGSVAAGLALHHLVELPLLRATGLRRERGAGQGRPD